MLSPFSLSAVDSAKEAEGTANVALTRTLAAVTSSVMLGAETLPPIYAARLSLKACRAVASKELTDPLSVKVAVS